MTEGCKNAAMQYVNWHHWEVIPVHHITAGGVCSCKKGAGCGSAGKHPMVMAWTTRPARSGADVETLWAKYPDANVGIVTGSRSRVWALDVDTDKGGGETYKRLFAPPTDTIRITQPERRHTTGGGGFHILYTLPSGVTITSRPLEGHPGIDIRGEDGMIVAPPSVSGKGPYTGWNDRNNVPSAAPDWLMGVVLAGEKGAAAWNDDGQRATTEPVNDDQVPRALALKLGEVGTRKGERSDRFFELVCLVREHGFSEGQAVTLLAEWCAYCQPPLYLGRLAGEVHRAWGKHGAKAQCLSIGPVPGYSGLNLSSLAFAPEITRTVPAPQDPERDPRDWAPPTVLPHPQLDARLDEAFPEFDFITWWERVDDPPVWVWEPFLEREGSLALYSRAKAGKSLLVLEGVAALCSGQAPPGATATQAPKHVAYVDRENPARGIVKRLRAMGYKPDQFLPHLHYYRYPLLPSLDTAEGGMLFVRQMLRVGVEMVVIDTTGKFMEGDEDKAATINALDRYAIQPLTRAGIAVLRLDHAGKNANMGQRGSSAKAAIGDGSYHLTRHGEWIHLKGELRSDESPEEILFVRRKNPLRHVVATDAERAMYEAMLTSEESEGEAPRKKPGRPRVSQETKVSDLIVKLEAHGVPLGAGWREAGKLLKAAGVGFDHNLLGIALDERLDRQNCPPG